MLSTFHFLRPWWFLAIMPAIILLAMFFKQNHRQRNNWVKYCDPHLLPHLIVENKAAATILLPWIVFLSWLLAILALAGPTWSMYAQPVYQKNLARVIALDVSQSMNAGDLSPSRLERAKYKTLDILHTIKEGQTGMIVFSARPFVVSPLTTDSNTIASMVPVLDSSIVPVQGIDLGLALNKSADLLRQAGFNKGQIILITDNKPNSKDLAIAQKLAETGITTSVIAVGSSQGGPVRDQDGNMTTDAKGNIVFANTDFAALEKLAASAGGNFTPFNNDNSDINLVLGNNLMDNLANAPSKNLVTKSLWRDEGHWLIWLLILVAAFLARKGWLDKIC